MATPFQIGHFPHTEAPRSGLSKQNGCCDPRVILEHWTVFGEDCDIERQPKEPVIMQVSLVKKLHV